MRLPDIHSHVLPNVDDGAKSVEIAIELLHAMTQQGITDVIATPHFDARNDNFEDYMQKVSDSFAKLEEAKKGLKLPKVYIGSEVYYFKGIGKSSGIRALTINKSPYLLLELQMRSIDSSVITDINNLVNNIGLIPIIAHIERYANQHGFKKLLELIKDGSVLAQVNAQSVLQTPYKRAVHKLIKKGYISYIATDSHSPDLRPPLMKEALDAVAETFGAEMRDRFVHNLDEFFRAMTGHEEANRGEDEKQYYYY